MHDPLARRCHGASGKGSPASDAAGPGSPKQQTRRLNFLLISPKLGSPGPRRPCNPDGTELSDVQARRVTWTGDI